MAAPFTDRREAGRRLADTLQTLLDPRTDPISGSQVPVVLALPRGGVPVAFEVARRLRAPLALFLVRKLGLPWQPEVAMGAIAEGGLRVLNGGLIGRLGVSADDVERVAAQELLELERRAARYRHGATGPVVRGRSVIVVDDGLATGATMQAALLSLREQHPARLVAAVPVAPPETCASLARDADDVVCLEQPPDFRAVGEWYEDFTQTGDDEVLDLLDDASEWMDAPPA